MVEKISLQPNSKDSFMTKVIARLDGVDEEEVLETLEKGEPYIIEEITSFNKEESSVILLIVASEKYNKFSEEKQKRLQEKHDMSDEEIKIIKNFPNVDISKEKYNEIVDDLSENIFSMD